jgi:hypothetical protein
MTMLRKTLFAAAFAAGLMGAGAAAQAQVATITIAPPAPRYEVVPAPVAGRTWAPGHWEWRHGQYVWEAGHWVVARAGYEYRAPRWVQRADGTWIMVGNNWERRMEERQARREAFRDERREERRAERRWERRHDSDRDGVPDRYDHHPYNPNRS